MKIDEIAASWDRVKVSIGAGPRWQTVVTPDLEIYGNPQNPWKSMEIHEISWKSWNPWKSMEMCRNRRKSLKIWWQSTKKHENLWTSTNTYENMYSNLMEIPETSFVRPRKSPAAGEKTLTRILHDIKVPGHRSYLLWRKERCHILYPKRIKASHTLCNTSR